MQCCFMQTMKTPVKRRGCEGQFESSLAHMSEGTFSHCTAQQAWVRHYENMPILNILGILPPKNENFQMKKSDIFHINAQNIDCGYSLEPLGGSNEYPQSMVLSRNKKNNVYPCQPKFYYIKVGFKGVKII